MSLPFHFKPVAADVVRMDVNDRAIYFPRDHSSISTDDWTPEQLRAVADDMENRSKQYKNIDDFVGKGKWKEGGPTYSVSKGIVTCLTCGKQMSRQGHDCYACPPYCSNFVPINELQKHPEFLGAGVEAKAP